MSSKNMTFQEYLDAIESARNTFPLWRKGQACFNVLQVERPDLIEQVRGSAFDPFHKAPEDLYPFFEWVQSHW